MAKFQRLGPVWRKPKPNTWQKQKNLTRWANLRQWTEEFDPVYTPATEILSGEGFAIVTEASYDNNPIYIIVE